MWINDKKINFKKIIDKKGLITGHENVPVMTGLGDSTILRCTFENGETLEIEFLPEELKILCANLKK